MSGNELSKKQTETPTYYYKGVKKHDLRHWHWSRIYCYYGAYLIYFQTLHNISYRIWCIRYIRYILYILLQVIQDKNVGKWREQAQSADRCMRVEVLASSLAFFFFNFWSFRICIFYFFAFIFLTFWVFSTFFHLA